MTPVEIEFLMRDKLTPGMDKAGKSADNLGKKADAVNKTIKDRIEEQRKVIQLVENDIKSLEKEYSKLSPGRAKMELSADLAAAKKVLQEEKNALQELSKQHDETSVKAKRLTTELREMQEELAKMRMEGKSGSQTYEDLRNKAALLADTLGDVRNETKILAHDNSGLQGLISGFNGISGVVTTATGIMGVFAKENEDLMKIQTRVQSVMAITMGIQQVMNTLNKDSQFRIHTLTKAKNLLTVANTRLATSLNVTNKTAKGLMMGGVGLLIAGVMSLITYYKKLNAEKKEHQKLQSEAINSTLTEVNSTKSLETVLKNGNLSYETRLGALKKLQELMPSYNAMLDKEGKLISDNTGSLQKYTKQLQSAAKAKIYSEKLANTQTEYNEWLRDLTSRQKGILLSRGVDLNGADQLTYNLLNAKVKEFQKNISSYQRSLDEAVVGQLTSEMPMEGTKAYYEYIISQKQKAMEAFLPSSKEYASLKAERDAAKNMASLWDESESNKIQSSAYERQRDAERRRIELMYQYNDLELKVREELISQKQVSYEKELEMIQLNYDKEYNEALKHQQDMLSIQQDAEYDEWKKKNPNWQSKGLMFSPVTTDVSKLPNEQKEQIEKIFSLSYTQYTGNVKKLFDDLMKSNVDYQTKREQLERDFNDTIKNLNAGRNEENTKEVDRAIDQATKIYKDGVSNISRMELEEGGIWKKLMGDISSYPTEVLQKLFDDAEKAIGDSTALSAQDVKTLMDTLNKARVELIQKNPFKSLTVEYQKYQKAIKNKDAQGASDSWSNVTVASDAIKENISLLGGALSQFSSVFSESVSGSIDKATAMINQGITAFQMLGKKEGRTASETMQGVSSLVGLITTLFSGFISVIDDSSRKEIEHARQQAAYWESINYQVEKYIELLKQAGGEDYFQIANDSLGKLSLGLEEARKEVLRYGNSTAKEYALGVLVTYHQLGKIDLNSNEIVKQLDKLFGSDAGTLGLYKHRDLAKEIINTIGDLSNESLLAAKENEEFWKKLPATTQEAIDKFIEYYEKISDLQEQLNQELFQTTSLDITDIIINGLKDSQKGLEDFGEEFETIMRNALLHSFEIDVLRDKAKAFYEKYKSLADSNSDGQLDLTAEEVASLREEWDQIVQGAIDERDKINQIIGSIGGDDTASQSGKAGAFTTMTQEQGTKLEGLFTSVQMHVANVDNTVENIGSALGDALGYIQKIEEHTGLSSKMLSEIKESMERIRAEGLLMK